MRALTAFSASPTLASRFCSCCACSWSIRISAIIWRVSLSAARAGVAGTAAASVSAAATIVFFMVAILFCGDDEMRAAVLRVRVFIVAGVKGEFLAVADRSEAFLGNPERHEICARRDGPPFAQCQIVLGGPPFVAVAFDGDRPRRILLENRRIFLKSCLRRARQ